MAGEYVSEPEEEEEDEPDEPALYLTAVSGGEILLLRDGEVIRRAPDYGGGHRARKGHLYSDAVAGRETVVFKDGKELFRYPGEEVIMGFAVREDGIHTLGQRAGGGFSRRVNGVELFSDATGRIIGSPSLTEWDDGAFSDGLCYCYAIPVGSSWEYRVMDGATTMKIIPADISGGIYDIRVIEGEVYIAAKNPDSKHACLVHGDQFTLVYLYGTETPGGIWIVRRDGAVCLKGSSLYPDGILFCSWVKNGSGTLDYASCTGGTISDLLEGGHIAEKDGKVWYVYSGGRHPDVEEGRYILGSRLCKTMADSTFCAALSDTLTGRHLLLTGPATSVPYHFPGRFTSVRYE